MMTEEENKYFQEGWRYFLDKRFYESHEEWEHIWLQRSGPDRDFFQGLILLAASFLHINKGKVHEAQIAFEKVILKLSRFPQYYLGVDVGYVVNSCLLCLFFLQESGVDSVFKINIHKFKIST